MNVALWQHSGGECLLRGNQPPPPELPHCLAAEDHTLLPQADNRTLGPASAGPFLVSKHLGTISRVPDLLWCGRRETFRSMTKLEPRFGGAFFALRKARSTVEVWPVS